MVAPKLAMRSRRSRLIQSGMKMVTGCPNARPIAANEIPLLPLDASTMVLPGRSRPSRVASSRMCSAIRSLMLPVRFSCSHLA
jgi:hypothetical protein